MAILNFFRDATREAPASALLPIAVAGAILVVVLCAFICQLSLWRRYAGFRRLTLLISRRLGSNPPIQVRDAVTEIVGQTSRGFGAILSAMVDSAAMRRGIFRPETTIDAVDDGENQIFRAAFVRWVSGAALIMGLAGTFVAFVQLIAGSGLLEALSTLGHAPRTGTVSPQLADSYVELSSAFGHVYQALGYAFLSSLAGLLGTIILGFIGSILIQPSKARALLVLEKFAEGLYAMVAPSTDQTANLVTALTTAATALETSGQTIESLRQASEYLESAARRFENAEQTNAQLASTLAVLTTELHASHQKWDLLVDALRESKQQLGGTMEAFKNEATHQREQTHSTVASAVSEMREITKVLSEEIRNVSAGKMDQFISIHDELQRTMGECKREWEQAGAEIVAQTSGAFENALKTVSEMVVNSREDAANTRQEMAELAKENLKAVGDIIASSRGDTAKTHQEMVGLTRQATEVVTHHETVLGAHGEAVTASLKQWSNAPAALEHTLAASTHVINKLSTTLDRLTEMPARWEQGVVGSIRRLEDKLQNAETRAQAEDARSGGISRWWARLVKAAARGPAK